MNKIIYITILSFLLINEVKSQDLFSVDLNGDKKSDIISITNDNGRGLNIKQFYSGRQLWKFDYLNEFYFPISNYFSSYALGDIDGNGRTNIAIFSESGNDKNIWFFSIEPNKLEYLGHTLLENAADTKEYLADITGDGKEELILIKDIGTEKHINSYSYFQGDFYPKATFITTGNPKKEHFADITGDGKDDLILTQDYGRDKRVWTFRSDGESFVYSKYTNLLSNAGKDVFFMNSNSNKDNRYDLLLVANTLEGKRTWLFESDGERFIYEPASNLFPDGNNRSILFGDINMDKSEDIVLVNSGNDAWTFESKGNMFEYRLHTSLNYDGVLGKDRRVDWHDAGYQGGKPLPDVSSMKYIEMPSPASDPSKNDDNFDAALENAANLKVNPNEHIVILFQQGTYVFNNQIVLDYNAPNHSYIVLKGQGIKTGAANNNYTELVYNIEVNTENPRAGNHFININGSLTYPNGADKDNAPTITEYDPLTNQITLNGYIDVSESDGKEWLLEILFTKGESEWHNDTNGDPDLDEYVGFISSADLVSGRTYQLEKDFTKSWNLFKNNTNEAKVYKFLPIKEVGLSDLSIRYHDDFEDVEKDSLNSTLVAINRTKNCWVDNIEISKVLSAGIGVGESIYAEVRNSYVHEAYDYGDGGRAYGVVIGSRSMHSKAENNVFRKLRHAMMVQHGSSHNVFGYNYSREQEDSGEINTLSDLNLHGYYPYANLFEGNIVDRIEADKHFGSNGSYNTFFRNYINFNQLKIVDMLEANIIDNKNAIITGSDATTFIFNNYNYKIFENLIFKEEYNYLPEASYYLREIPEFFKEFVDLGKVTWPAIGSPSLNESIFQNIPAKERWFNHLANHLRQTKNTAFNENNIEELEDIIYPNPNKGDFLYVKTKKSLKNIDIYINPINNSLLNKKYNYLTLNKNTIIIDVSDLPKGIYVLSLRNNGKTIHKKFIIQ